MDNMETAIKLQNKYFECFPVPPSLIDQNERNIGDYIFIIVHLNRI